MYTYGPVPSRRLGRSLGVSPIPPKTCSYTCIYCQLGKTTHLQVKRKSFFPKENILAEIRKRRGQSDIDYVTFVGDGEPTLCKDLGWLITQTKNELNLPVAVITNGSLLFLDEVRNDLINADVVLPTLDAGDEKTFRTVNRPHRSITFELMRQGLIDFRREFTGQIWLEVMLVEGVNDSNGELKSIKKSIDLIKPDRVYVMTPIRPPAESWVKPPAPEVILKAQHILDSEYALATQEQGDFGFEEFGNAREAILEIGSRHPLRREQALAIEKAFFASNTVTDMLREGELVEINYNGNSYLLPEHFIISKKNR